MAGLPEATKALGSPPYDEGKLGISL